MIVWLMLYEKPVKTCPAADTDVTGISQVVLDRDVCVIKEQSDREK
jgi:hypothetical protein